MKQYFFGRSFPRLLTLVRDFDPSLFSAVSERQAGQEGHVDRLRDPRQGVDLSGLLLVVRAPCESFEPAKTEQ